MYSYSPENARIYSELGVVGTTYEVSFNELARLLGDITEKTVLDYGTGTGRSALLLASLGAKTVIGVDHDLNMISQAQQKTNDTVSFKLITDNKIPLPDNSIDIAVTAHVFVEIKSLTEMLSATKEIARVLRPGGTLILITTNPNSIGHRYLSYSYQKPDALSSGDPITCVVHSQPPFEINDTYWTEADYRSVVTEVGFKIIQITYPTATGDNWLDETEVAPDLVLQAQLLLTA